MKLEPAAIRLGTMRMLRVAVLCALALLASCITAHVTAPTVSAVPYRIQQFTLASGLRAVAEAAPDFGVAGAVLVVETGSADEPPGKGGLAHLVEHLVFQAKHDGKSFWDRLQDSGAGNFNASTDWDLTTYHAFGPASAFPSLVSLLAEVADDPLAGVDDEAFEHERQVVLNELHSHAEDGTPGEQFGALSGAVFPADHPYAHPIVGTEESIRGLTLDDARQFAKEHYKPNRAVIALTSPTSYEAQSGLLTKIEASHGWAPAAPEPRAIRRTADATTSGRPSLVTRDLNVSNPAIWVGWSLPSWIAPQSDASSVLLSMVDSTFWYHVYDHDTDIAYVTASIESGLDASEFVVQATLKEGANPQASADSLLRTMIHGFGEGTYLGESLGFYKRTVATRLSGAEAFVIPRTMNAAASLAVTGSPTFLRSKADRVVALDSGSVSDFYRQYLSADRAHTVFFRPSTRGRASTVAAGIPVGGEGGNHEQVSGGPAPSQQDVEGWMRSPHLAEARQATLDNGLQVVVLARPGAAFHSLILAYHGGVANEPTPGAGIASLWSKQRFRISSATWGVAYWDGVEPDVTYETMGAPGTDIGLTLRELGNEHDFRVFWPPDQFRSRLEAYKRQDRFPDTMFTRRLKRALFGAHPYGRTTTNADLEAVLPKDVYQFMDAIRSPNNGIAVLVGDVDPAAAMATLSAQLGSARAPAGPAPTAAPPPPLGESAAQPGQRIVVQDRPGSDSGRMVFRCLVPRVDAQALGATGVFAQALHNLFFGELRRRTAESYTVRTHTEYLRNGAAVIDVASDVDEGRLPLAVNAVRRWVEQPAGDWLNERVVTEARQGQARRFNLSFDSSQELAWQIVNMWNRGWPIDTFDHLPEQVMATKPADLAPLSDACKANWVLGFLGNQAPIVAAIGGWNP